MFHFPLFKDSPFHTQFSYTNLKTFYPFLKTNNLIHTPLLSS